MRTWQLTAADPLALQLAADARLFSTNYNDDQIWELELGQGQSPALALTTRYGGRCGLARLVPMWLVEGRVIYEAAAFAAQPVVAAITPSLLTVEARPVSHLTLTATYWAVESHVVAGQFTLQNEGQQPADVDLDLFAQVMADDREGKISVLTLSSGQHGLHLHDVGNLQPVVLIEADAQPPQEGRASPRLTARMTLPAGEAATIRWVHAGLPTRDTSLQLAHHWLYEEDWSAHLDRLAKLNARIPEIETGDPARDAVLAFAYNAIVSSFVGPTGQMPNRSFVLARTKALGYSPRGDGSDHPRLWSGQTALSAYGLLPLAAGIAPRLAQGVLRNFLATAGEDGFVDWKPGLGGQREGVLSVPLLATLAWQVFQQTEDAAFLEDVFPGVLRFFDRWFAPDVDRDQDGLPEWQDTAQSGYSEHPSFAPYRRWAQNADISKVEAPDLAAYLLREARSLLAIAEQLGQRAERKRLQARLNEVQTALDALWHERSGKRGSYHYRDRDTHQTPTGRLVAEGPADAPLLPSLELQPPNRLILRALGGRDSRPNFTVTLEGLNGEGEGISETLPGEAFVWHRGLGAATSDGVYSRIDRIEAQGLSRVYAVQVASVDLTRQDLTLLMPLWAGLEDEERAEAVMKTLADAKLFWRANGLAMCSAQDPAYDPANVNGSGGVWQPWNLMLGEALVETGRPDLAAQLFEELLAAQQHFLTTEHAFREAVNSDELGGLGESGHVVGAVGLLGLFWALLGVRIVSPRKVWVGGQYTLPWPVTVRHLGVSVERTRSGAKITFPSGEVKRARSAKWRAIEDAAADAPPAAPPELGGPPPGPAASTGPSAGTPPTTIRIPVRSGSPDEGGEAG